MVITTENNLTNIATVKNIQRDKNRSNKASPTPTNLSKSISKQQDNKNWVN